MKTKIVGIQGDVMFVKVLEIPDGSKERTSNVLVYGEATNHSHKIDVGSIYDCDNEMYLQVTQPIGRINHEEHDPIELPAGNYQIIRQREYKGEDMTALVID